MTPIATLQLSNPAFVEVEAELNGETKKALIDIYEARRTLEFAYKQPNEEKRYEVIGLWVASKLGYPEGTKLAENQALEFNDMVTVVVTQLNSVRSGKSSAIASLLELTPESQPTSAIGIEKS